jgi:hypothetical protein
VPSLKAARADGDRKTVAAALDALAGAHGIPASYPVR